MYFFLESNAFYTKILKLYFLGIRKVWFPLIIKLSSERIGIKTIFHKTAGID